MRVVEERVDTSAAVVAHDNLGLQQSCSDSLLDLAMVYVAVAAEVPGAAPAPACTSAPVVEHTGAARLEEAKAKLVVNHRVAYAEAQ